MPPGAYPYLFNVRVIEEGRFDSRPGYTTLINISPTNYPNSIRRLNDPSHLYASSGYIYVGGAGTELYAGIESAYAGVDSGYSGNPLSLIPFRPENSPESWMYVYDQVKMSKVRPDGAVFNIGIVPPSSAPAIEYAVPATVDVDTGQESSGWTASGQLTTPSFSVDRTNGSTATIGNIIYNTGSTGWCCINPAMGTPQTFWMGARMKVKLSGGSEVVTVREVWPAIPSTTVAGINYDVGTSGLCTIVLAQPIAAIGGSPAGLNRNSLIEIDSEVVRVLEVVLSPSGTTYSIRCKTASTHTSGATVIGLLSWYVYTTGTHAASETITTLFVEAGSAGGTSTTGTLTRTVSVNAAVANLRPIDTANDYLHISLFLQNPQFVVNIQLLASLDPTPSFDFINPGNTWIWTIAADQLNPSSSGDSWVEIDIPISQGVRSGNDLTLTLASISGLAIQVNTQASPNNACGIGFDWWYFFGTYGPVIQPNSPTGYQFYSSNRDSTTGAHSVPGPGNRYQLYPLREGVIITPSASNQTGVDTNDIYVEGGTIDSPLYVGSVTNNYSSPNSYTDSLPDSSILEANQAPDLLAIQPWPLLQPPIMGTCNVVGTSVEWVSGGTFPATMLNDTEITIAGNAFLTYGQPRSSTFLEVTEDAGNLMAVSFIISSPTLAGQPLPYAFGPLEGPFAPVVFALGDPINGGLLYFSNFDDADSASDANTLELAPPAHDLVSGEVWNGMVFVGNRENCFLVRFTYLTSIGASNNTSFQWTKLPTPSGMWSRWTCCSGPDGIYYLGRDGIYKMTEQGAVNISDAQLYPLFPHDGQPAVGAVAIGDNAPIFPVNMSLI